MLVFVFELIWELLLELTLLYLLFESEESTDISPESRAVLSVE